MACASCGNRRKIMAQVIDGNKPLKQGAREIASTFKKDVRSIAGAVRPGKIGLRIK